MWEANSSRWDHSGSFALLSLSGATMKTSPARKVSNKICESREDGDGLPLPSIGDEVKGFPSRVIRGLLCNSLALMSLEKKNNTYRNIHAFRKNPVTVLKLHDLIEERHQVWNSNIVHAIVLTHRMFQEITTKSEGGEGGGRQAAHASLVGVIPSNKPKRSTAQDATKNDHQRAAKK